MNILLFLRNIAISKKTISNKFYFVLLAVGLCSSVLFSQSTDFGKSLSSTSFINWEKGIFVSNIELDVYSANISLPAGRNVATNRIAQKLPLLVKNPLLTVTVNSSTQMGDAVLWELITIGEISDLISEGEKSPSVFSRTGELLTTNHTIKLQDLTSPLILHEGPYTPNIPIDRVSSRPYTGIIIDARGQLPVRGEFTHEKVEPALFPRIWDEEMNLLYEINMVEPEIVKKSGLVKYSSKTGETEYEDRVGNDPLRIFARGVFGIHRTDPIISRNDALKILSIPENVELLKQGKVVLLLDEESLAYSVEAPLKDENYYYMVQEVSDFIFENIVEDLEVYDTEKGMLIPLRDLKFAPDSATILPEENDRLDVLAQSLILATEDGNSTILVEGHTASIGLPEGEQILSIERAITIINELVERGVNEDLFTYRGYGGEIPIGDNATEEGRAANRRVEITVVPRQRYIQRIY